MTETIRIEKTLGEKIDSWMEFYQEEAVRFEQMYFEKAVQYPKYKLEEIIQWHGFSIALEVNAKCLANLRMRHINSTEDELKEALQKFIREIHYCIELDTKHWLNPETRKPWTKHTDILMHQAIVSKNQDAIDELTRLIVQ